MTPEDQRLIELIEREKANLVREATQTAIGVGGVVTSRESVEQMLNGVIAVIEEALRGESDATRRLFLETAMTAIVESGVVRWSHMLRAGLPCWGVMIGRLVMLSPPEDRDAVLARMSVVMGAWFEDLSNAVVPLCVEHGSL